MENVAIEVHKAGAPTVEASQNFLQSVQKLENSIPLITESAQAHNASRDAMLAAAESLQEGIRGYTQFNELASTMIQELHSTL